MNTIASFTKNHKDKAIWSKVNFYKNWKFYFHSFQKLRNYETRKIYDYKTIAYQTLSGIVENNTIAKTRTTAKNTSIYNRNTCPKKGQKTSKK